MGQKISYFLDAERAARKYTMGLWDNLPLNRDFDIIFNNTTGYGPVQRDNAAYLKTLCRDEIPNKGDDDDEARYLVMFLGDYIFETFPETDIVNTSELNVTKRNCSLVQSFWRLVTPGEHPLTRHQSIYTHDQLLYVDLLYFAFLNKREGRGQIRAGEQVELLTLTDYFEHLKKSTE